MALLRGLNPTLSPIPAQCADNVFNVSCAVQMAQLCNTNTTNGPALLDATSNCRLWKDLVETAYDLDPQTYFPIQDILDRCILNYCANAGVESNACECLNFPNLMEAQCNAQASRGCNIQTPPGQINTCPGKVFTRFGGGYTFENKSGNTETPTYIIVEFKECIPYYCWNDLCWQPETLLVSSIRNAQGTCISGICINVQGVDQITLSDLTPPANPQTFRPRQLLINACGSGAKPAFPLYFPTAWTFPINATSAIPLAFTNVGDDILNLTLRTITNNPYGAFAPNYITIGPHGSYNFNVTFDNSLLSGFWTQSSTLTVNNGTVRMVPFEDEDVVPLGFLKSPEFFYTYMSGDSLQTLSFGLTLSLTPPIPSQSDVQPFVVNKDIPLPLNISLIVAGVIFLICALVLLFVQARARNVADDIFKVLV